jgi:GH15 family glucan-1,4-alpha-glucosidase
MAYLPIEQYGLVGNMRTAALVGTNGSIDWFCYPSFDAPSVFGALLDDRRGGRFQIAPVVDHVTRKQLYLPESNVLVTRFLSADGVGQVVDFMPVGLSRGTPGRHALVRQVSVVRGSVRFRLECRPAFNYARDHHQVTIAADGAAFHAPAFSLGLMSSIPLQRDGGAAMGEFTLEDGQQLTFLLTEIERGATCTGVVPPGLANELFTATIEYWRRWMSHCTYRGRWREIVSRSALVLKLLTYEPTGAIVASPTCSLPERIGGARNWDYRFTWLRDAAFTLYGLMRIGFTEEAEAFMTWLEARCREIGPDGALQIMYGIDGRHELDEEVLDHLEGYRGSAPVRIGNAAHKQLQLDIYGELMDSVYLYNKYGSPISFDMWSDVRRLVDWTCENWQRTDEGIWEVRGGPQHFVFSKLMCWVALDRALRLADKRSFPASRERWQAARDRIYDEIMTCGWNAERSAFVQHFGGHALDAANLLMPLVFFVSPTDPRMLQTLDAMMRPPAAGGLLSDSLVYRYDVEKSPDGLRGAEGTFNMCTFWLVEALTRAGLRDRRRLDRGRLIFEQMLGYANHLGLYAEETGPSGEHLGNFPQAFTHLSLISAAFNLDRALGPGA